jgi:hypothetical protein
MTTAPQTDDVPTTFWTSRHPGALAIRALLRRAAILGAIFAVSVPLETLTTQGEPATLFNVVMILWLVSLFGGLFVVVLFAGSWSDVIDYFKTKGAVRYALGAILLAAGGGVMLLLVPTLHPATWQQRRGFGLIVVVGGALVVSGVRLLRR